MALAIMAKLAILFGLKMTVLMPMLSGASSSSYGDSVPQLSITVDDDDDLLRIKRSGSFIQELGGREVLI